MNSANCGPCAMNPNTKKPLPDAARKTGKPGEAPKEEVPKGHVCAPCMRPPRRSRQNQRKMWCKPAAFGDYRKRRQRPLRVSPAPSSFPYNLPVATACICLQRASCCIPATCQLQLVLNSCSRCIDCKKAVVWYNSVLDPLPLLLALICSCRCAFCKHMMPLIAHKNSTRHYNTNQGMSAHTGYPHVLNSLCQCISIRNVLTRTANRRMSSSAKPPPKTTTAT